MLAEERFAQILALMAEKRTATVQELCEALNASESTIRRDLNELDRLGKVNKVHGGATLPDSQFRADEPMPVCWPRKAAGCVCPAGCSAPRQRPSSGRQRCRACSSTTSPRPLWEPTAWRWKRALPPRTPRKQP